MENHPALSVMPVPVAVAPVAEAVPVAVAPGAEAVPVAVAPGAEAVPVAVAPGAVDPDEVSAIRRQADLVEAICFTVSRPELCDLGKAVEYSKDLTVVAMVVAFRKRAKMVVTRVDGFEEVAAIREALVARVFQTLKENKAGFDLDYVRLQRSVDFWNIFSEGRTRYQAYLAGVKALEGLPMELARMILE
jgi:hypothetical protein